MQAMAEHVGRNGPPKSCDGILTIFDLQDGQIAESTKKIRRADVPEWVFERDKPEESSFLSLARLQQAYIKDLQAANVQHVNASTALVVSMVTFEAQKTESLIATQATLQAAKPTGSFWESDAGTLLVNELSHLIKPLGTLATSLIAKKFASGGKVIGR